MLRDTGRPLLDFEPAVFRYGHGGALDHVFLAADHLLATEYDEDLARWRG